VSSHSRSGLGGLRDRSAHGKREDDNENAEPDDSRSHGESLYHGRGTGNTPVESRGRPSGRPLHLEVCVMAARIATSWRQGRANRTSVLINSSSAGGN